MGVLAPGSAHAWPSTQPPIDTSGKKLALVSGRGVNKNEKKILINFLAISGDSTQNPTITPSGRNVSEAEQRRKKRP